MTELDPLSSREREVVQLLLEGKSNKQIAAALHISESTVEFHLKNSYAKYLVSSRVELILKLRQSTVAGEGEAAENRDRPNRWDWAASLREAVSKTGREIKMTFSNSNARGDGSPLTFFESIRVCLTKYAEFQGRASRAEFWWFALFVLLVVAAMTLLSEILGRLFLIATLLPLLAAGTRRLRDSGRSGWWQLFLLVPAGIVVVGILWAQPPTSPPPEDRIPA